MPCQLSALVPTPRQSPSGPGLTARHQPRRQQPGLRRAACHAPDSSGLCQPGDYIEVALGWGRVSESTTVPKEAGPRASKAGAVHTAGGGPGTVSLEAFVLGLKKSR